MGYKSNEILFNKKKLKSPIEQTNQTAKKILYILSEVNVKEKMECSSELINIYTKRINKSSQRLTRKIQYDDFRPFEFLVNRN